MSPLKTSARRNLIKIPSQSQNWNMSLKEVKIELSKNNLSLRCSGFTFIKLPFILCMYLLLFVLLVVVMLMAVETKLVVTVMTAEIQTPGIFLEAGWQTYLKGFYFLKAVGHRQKSKNWIWIPVSLLIAIVSLENHCLNFLICKMWITPQSTFQIFVRIGDKSQEPVTQSSFNKWLEEEEGELLFLLCGFPLECPNRRK